MFQFKFVSKMRANGWFSEAMFVPAVVIDLVRFISVTLSNVVPKLPVQLLSSVIVNDFQLL